MSLIAKDHCYVCDESITFNLLLVPSIQVGDKRRPLCGDCVKYANPRRVSRGLTAIKVWPGTYDPHKETKFNFEFKIGPSMLEVPQKPRLVGWQEHPDGTQMLGGVYWGITLTGTEQEDLISFTGSVEEKQDGS